MHTNTPTQICVGPAVSQCLRPSVPLQLQRRKNPFEAEMGFQANEARECNQANSSHHVRRIVANRSAKQSHASSREIAASGVCASGQDSGGLRGIDWDARGTLPAPVLDLQRADLAILIDIMQIIILSDERKS